MCFFIVDENLHQSLRDTSNCFSVVGQWNDEGEGHDDGKRVEEDVG
jgi:hypothetical protein